MNQTIEMIGVLSQILWWVAPLIVIGVGIFIIVLLNYWSIKNEI